MRLLSQHKWEFRLSKHPEEKISPSDAYQRRDEEQRERLFELLSHDHFEAISDMPYMSRLLFEKWHIKEDERIGEWFDALSGVPPDVSELGKLLNSAKPDIQLLAKWCDEQKIKVPLSILVQLFSEGKRVGITENMRQRGNKLHEKFRGTKAEVIRIWEQQYKGKVSRNIAAELMIQPIQEGGHGIPLKYKTVREYLIGS